MKNAEECKKLKDLFLASKEKIDSTKAHMNKIERARKKARNAVVYWRQKDPLKYAKWLCVMRKANEFMSECDRIVSKGEKSINSVQVIDVDSAIDSNISLQNEVITQDGTLQNEVVTQDGTLQKVDNML